MVSSRFHIIQLLALTVTVCRAFLAPTTPARSSALLSAALESLDPKETAVVLVEYQNEFCTPGGKLHDAVKESMEQTNMLENSSKLLQDARDTGCTIIHLPIAFEKGHNEIADTPYGILAGVKEGEAFTQGEWGADFAAPMRPAPMDKIAKGKSGLCGFYSTNLDFLLRQGAVKNIVLGGFLTNCCVESTMRTGYEHGYKVYTLEDCCAATSVEAHKNAFANDFGMFSVPTKSTEVISALKASSSVQA
ncbi:amidohydrolase RutB [Seminavis robusta]|uniref:Amidohydrolase RutB n=1 Tax=Seminavis robusta TaxID=568900 RepID=A0A9N8DQV3_9STRA|nr:amidohydrolase RutB [Seminavis robusta]|eukprot:Sro274_g105430.1 amidohydrolase RutB (248) ;mRNA; r:39624-40625